MQKLKTDPYVANLLEYVTEGKKIRTLRKGAKVFLQGSAADGIYFIETGSVKLTVTSATGKDAVLAEVGRRDFFGEGCLVGQPLRIYTAITTQASILFKIQTKAMLQALQDQPRLSEKFVASLLVRNIDVEQDVGDQLFSRPEKRLARVLLKLSRFGQHDFLPDARLTQLSDETLAHLVGTTPSRILNYLSKFGKLGLVQSHRDGTIAVRAEMLADLVLHI
jgi:CRP/FNR family cyclic AMP-dependent transcriptional regulator